MPVLIFEDNELDILIDAVNAMQVCFHPQYAPDGHFSARDLIELSSDKDDVLIIADKNIISPICEIASTGSHKSEEQLRRAACFVLWSRFLNARMSCGLSIAETDTAGISKAPGETERQQFFHGVDVIPSFIWKGLAFGNLEEIPEQFLYAGKKAVEENYSFENTIDLLSNKAVIAKIIEILRDVTSSPIDQFLSFMEWYAACLPLTPCVILYAAMVFTDTHDVQKPKFSNSADLNKVFKGIMNQAWDLTYITSWNRIGHIKQPGQEYLFATDDNTQKSILVNLFKCYPDISAALNACFPKKRDMNRISDFYSIMLGGSSVNPLNGKTEHEQFILIKSAEKSTMESLFGECAHDFIQ